MPRSAADRAVLGPLSPDHLPQLLSASSDITLVVDAAGDILDVLTHGDDEAARQARKWRGRPWTETVTIESRPKVEAMLKEADLPGGASPLRWRQVNHMLPGGDELPVVYAAVRVAGRTRTAARRLVAFGRDLRTVVALQRQLVESQQAMEQDHWRLREAETRYRHLLETSSEALLVLEGATQRVVEANPAAKTLFAPFRAKLLGALLGQLVDDDAGERVQDLLAAARSVGRNAAVVARLAGGDIEVSMSASVFRRDDNAFVLVRLLPLRDADGEVVPRGAADPATGALAQAFVQHAVEALVFCDGGGRIVNANRAFLAMAELGADEQANGQPLDRWLGRTGVELGVLITNLRQRGSVARFVTSLRGEYGGRIDVEVSGTRLPMAEATLFAFSLRELERRVRTETDAAASMQRSVGELAELVGRTPMKDIVAETTDLIEQLCIQTALQMSGDNRASAAQLLGLSRQSLYVKLHRYGLGSLGGEG